MKSIPEMMQPYRKRINDLDDRIIDLLSERTEIIREVAHFKYDNNISAILQDRVDEVRERAAQRAEEKNIDPETIRLMYRILVSYSCNLEQEIMDVLDDESCKVIGQ